MPAHMYSNHLSSQAPSKYGTTYNLSQSTAQPCHNLDKHCNPHQHPVGVEQHCQLRLGGHRMLTSIIQQPTHQHPVGVGQHCQLRLGGHLTLTSIIQQPTHQHPVGVGQHCQLRLGGNLTLTSIIQQPTHQHPVGVEQHCQLRLGGHLTLTSITNYTYVGLQPIAIQLQNIKSQTDRQTEPNTHTPNSNLVSPPSHHPIRIIPFTS